MSFAFSPRGSKLEKVATRKFGLWPSGRAALPGLPALILTDAGHSISTILPANYDETLRDIIALMRKAVGHDKIFEFRRRGDGSYERVTSETKNVAT
jgi:hypothetical protein